MKGTVLNDSFGDFPTNAPATRFSPPTHMKTEWRLSNTYIMLFTGQSLSGITDRAGEISWRQWRITRSNQSKSKSDAWFNRRSRSYHIRDNFRWVFGHFRWLFWSIFDHFSKIIDDFSNRSRSFIKTEAKSERSKRSR